MKSPKGDGWKGGKSARNPETPSLTVACRTVETPAGTAWAPFHLHVSRRSMTM